MTLTGKAKEDFENWNRGIEDNDYGYIDIEPTSINVGFEDLYPRFQNNIIIEWLDSVGIYIQVGAISTHGQPVFDYNIQEDNTINGMNGHTFRTRHEATTEAIKQANIIYNGRY